MIKFVSISLITLGSFLEIFYYIFRFTSGDGDNIYIAIIKGVALTIMLSGITLLFKNNKLYGVAFAVLMIYSIICTSAGQSMQYATMAESKMGTIYKTDPVIMQLNADIEQLRDESKQLAGLRMDVDLYDKWKYEGVINRTNNESEELTTRIKQKINEIEQRKKIIEDIKQDDLYTFYQNLFRWPIRWSQFILQTALSFFIALMAPLGIMLIDNKKEPREKKSVVSATIITDWVFYTWYLHRNKGIKSIPPDKAVIDLMRKRYPEYTEGTHFAIKNIAKKNNLIDDKNNVVYTVEKQAVKKLLELLEG